MWSPTLRIGYVTQELGVFDNTKTVIENLLLATDNRTEAFAQARSLQLTESAIMRPHQLSRGQQAKLAFAMVLLQRFDVLVLDEVLNHMDIATRELLETALGRYEGAIIYVTHDEYFAAQLGGERLQLG